MELTNRFRVTEKEYLRRRANAPAAAKIGGNGRTAQDAIKAAGYATHEEEDRSRRKCQCPTVVLPRERTI